MQTPSIELLRALRGALNTTTRASRTVCRQQKPLSTYQASRFRVPSSRPFVTTTQNNDPSPPEARRMRNPYAPTHRDRGPKSSEDTQTDFGVMDVFGNIPAPATSIDACTSDGFHLDNGVKTEGGRGIVLVGGEAFNWEPWLCLPQIAGKWEQLRISDLLDVRRGTLNIPPQSLGLLELLHPKPDLLIFGTGARLWMLGQDCRNYVSQVLGCRIDMMDTANAAAAYNLLAKERGIEGGSGVGAVLLPGGWTGPKVQTVKRPGRR